MQNFFDPKFSCSKFWVKEKYWHEISFESKKILVKKIRVQKISFVPQEILCGLEKIFRPKNTGQNLDKRLKFTKKNWVQTNILHQIKLILV